MARLRRSAATGRAIYLGAIVGMIGILAGMTLAAGFSFSVTNLGQSQNYYGVSSASVPGYATSSSGASVDASYVPATVTACDKPYSTVDASTAGGTAAIVLSYSDASPTSACSGLDWAEKFNVSFSETFSASSGGYQTNNVTLITEVGGASAPTTNSVWLTVGAGTTGAVFNATLQIYVDYGTGVVPPSSGITTLMLEVH